MGTTEQAAHMAAERAREELAPNRQDWETGSRRPWRPPALRGSAGPARPPRAEQHRRGPRAPCFLCPLTPPPPPPPASRRPSLPSGRPSGRGPGAQDHAQQGPRPRHLHVPEAVSPQQLLVVAGAQGPQPGDPRRRHRLRRLLGQGCFCHQDAAACGERLDGDLDSGGPPLSPLSPSHLQRPYFPGRCPVGVDCGHTVFIQLRGPTRKPEPHGLLGD